MAQTISDINWDWVESHMGDDPIKLRLKKDASEHLLDIVQIECRKKACKKLSSTLGQNPRFIFGNTLASEQSTSDMLAQYHASLIPRGSKVCDLTSGLGIDVLNLAQRASSVTAIELQEDLCKALEINTQADPLDRGKVKVICGDCRDVLRGLLDDCENGIKPFGICETDSKTLDVLETEIKSFDSCGKDSKSFGLGGIDNKPFDVIFIDPARRSSTGKRLFSLHDCQPDVVEMIPLIRQACDTLIIKMSPMLDITQVCRELPCVSQIIVLGTNRECKELIAVCRWDKPEDEETEISVVSLSSVGVSDGVADNEVFKDIKFNKFSFYPSKESSISGVPYVDAQFIDRWMKILDDNSVGSHSCECSKSSKDAKKNKKGMSETHSLESCNQAGDSSLGEDNPLDEESLDADLQGENFVGGREDLYLYEPSPSMMKAGAYQLLAERFSLIKVAANSHLYLSDTLREDFPGSVWKVLNLYSLSSSTIKAIAKQNLKGEVAVRNYTMAAEALRKKLKIGNGVGYRYMATTTEEGKAYLFELESVDQDLS